MKNFLHTSIESLNYIPKEKIKTLHKLGIYQTKDLIFYMPRTYKTKYYNPDINQLIINEKQEIIISGLIIDMKISYGKIPSKIIFDYQNKKIELIFFSKIPIFVKKTLIIGNKYTITGNITRLSDTKWQIVQPNFIFHKKDLKEIEPIYSLSSGVSNRMITNFIRTACEQFLRIQNNYKEFNPLCDKYKWPSFFDAIKTIHNVDCANTNTCSTEAALQRLSSDELLAHHLNLKKFFRKQNKISTFPHARTLHLKLLENLPFSLTEQQQLILKMIEDDQNSQKQMVTLLQGDVGSGKTIIALLSALNVVNKNKQIAFLAPTELLAQQHYEYISNTTKTLNIGCCLIKGSIKKREKNKILTQIMNNEVQIIVGTHAIFQEHVQFNSLAYVIIDEQHRFGVMQRLSLINKSNSIADVLLMSATPIPRSLTLSILGNIKIINLQNTIKQRKPITTYTVSNKKEIEIYQFIDKIIQKKQKIYWVCPLIEESEQELFNNINNVENRYNQLEKQFPNKVSIMHGKMTAEEKNLKMQEFIQKNSILVATTIIEVGINIPEATLIIIENAEKFGLAQLHQLRGRVGRSSLQSYCILLYNQEKLTAIASYRLKKIKETEDGFLIAKEDLRIRGSGDIWGTKQSGKTDFFFADKIELSDSILQDIIENTNKLVKDPVSSSIYNDIFHVKEEMLH